MEALIRIQEELKVKKERHNKFGDFMYRNAEDILKAVKPLLQGAVLTLSDELKYMGHEVYFGATATLSERIGGEDYERSATAWAREEPKRPKYGPGQLSGAASSYARKYALGGLFLLDDGIDSDHLLPPPPNTPSGPADWTPTTGPGQQPQPEQPTAAQQSQPAAAPQQGQIPAPNPDQRVWLKGLWEWFVAQSEGRLQVVDAKPMQVMMHLCQIHLARYPGSLNDVEQLKTWIKIEDLIG